MRLTVFYDEQFWVGVVEEVVDDQLRASRHVFGAEPQDAEVLDFVNRKMLRLIDQSRERVQVKVPVERRVNPKRLQREAAREMKQQGISTYAQEAIKLEIESRKKEHKELSKQQREELEEKKWELKVAKAKAKHRGR